MNIPTQNLRKRAILLALLGLAPAFQFFGIQKPAWAALSCAVPGKDGSPSSALTGTVNTYYPGITSVSSGASSISLGTATGATTGITSGDLLLVIQMQDAAINSNNSNAYGSNTSSGSGSTSLNNSGVYEYVVATNSVTTSGGTLNLRNGLINSYTDAAATGTQGQRRFQVIRVPQYLNATLSSGLTASRWNGSTGGILAIDVAGTLQGSGATVNVDGLGFRGGGARQLSGASGGSNTDYRNLASNAFHASKGEGIAGTPRFSYTPGSSSVADNTTEGYPNGSFARGAPGNAGGGGSDANPGSNDQNTGGGGGSNGGTGGRGGFSWNTVQNYGGIGGAAFSGSATRLILGGGGGAGTRNNSTDVQGSGGTGGGIVLIRTGQLVGSATLSANGTTGISTANDGAGGAGAGGSLAITAFGGNGTLTLNASGGTGGNAWATQAPGTTDQLTPGANNARHGPGGGGGGGVILLPSSADGFAGTTTTSVAGGTNGITTTANSDFGATPGNAGQTATVSSGSIPGVAAGAQCLPDLTLTKSHVGTFTLGNRGTYTLTVGNNGGTSTTGVITVTDTLPTGLTLNNGEAGAVTLTGTNAADWTCTSNAASPQVIACSSSTAISAANTSVFSLSVNVGLGTAVGTNSVINTATVAGGGEINTTNNAASDPTTIMAGNVTVLLVKRITAINGSTNGRSLSGGVVDLTQLVDDPNTTNDNNTFWPSSYLKGAIDGGVAKPGDEVEYTIYFLSAGNTVATNVKLCDRIPDKQTFLPQGYISLPAAAGGDGSSRGIGVAYNGTDSSYTNLGDGDSAQYYERGVAPLPAVCGGNLSHNPTGAVVINLGEGATGTTGGSLPHATTAPNSDASTHGLVRFKAKVD